MELDEIRQRKLEELQQMQQQRMLEQQQEEAVFQQKVDMLERFVRSRLTKDALARYGNIKAADPEKAVQLLAMVAQMLQSRDGIVDDAQLKELLIKMSPVKKETRITRK
jgi:DNA-binding TFAR19-related protein (PDSD5 family)